MTAPLLDFTLRSKGPSSRCLTPESGHVHTCVDDFAVHVCISVRGHYSECDLSIVLWCKLDSLQRTWHPCPAMPGDKGAHA